MTSYIFERDTFPCLPGLNGTFSFYHTSSDRKKGISIRHLETYPLDELALPSGELLLGDPFHGIAPRDNAWIDIPPGTYPVLQTWSKAQEDGLSLPARVAYLSLILDLPLWKQRQFEKILLQNAQRSASLMTNLIQPAFWNIPSTWDQQQLQAYGKIGRVRIESGTLAMADRRPFELNMPFDPDFQGRTWLEQFFDHEVPHSWFHAVDSDTPYRTGAANHVYHPEHPEYMILSQAGFGAGEHLVFFELDEHRKKPIALHIDFGLIPRNPFKSLWAS